MKYASCHTDRKHCSRGLCGPCYRAEYRKENSDKIAEQQAEYYKENSDKIAEQKAEYYKANSDKIAEYRKANSDKIAEQKAEWYKANVEKIAEKQAEYRKENSDKIAEQRAEYYKENSDKIAKQHAKYVKANPGKRNAKNAKRRAAKLQRTPKWADLEAIQLFYINYPEGYEVDHMVPLQGATVSGLHVLDNLQYLTRTENRAKGNKLLDKYSKPLYLSETK